MEDRIKKIIINELSKLVTDERLALFHSKLNDKTQNLTVVLEDVFQSRNINAVIRSADCFGISDIHLIENRNTFIVDHGVNLGSAKWTNIIQYNSRTNNTKQCLNKLKKRGYKIIAAIPNENATKLEDINVNKNKIAVLFGTELDGLSEEALKIADDKMKIKMYGFTESLNISVAAGIILQHLNEKIRKENATWRIKEKDRDNILLNWLRNSIVHSEKIEKDIVKRIIKI